MPRALVPEIDWPTIAKDFTCPPTIWKGVWKDVGDVCGRTWDVWAAVYSALSAMASRNLFWHYFRAPLFGMSYTLIVAPTGMGKEYALEIINALLPENFNQRDTPQSGQALFAMMVDPISREAIKPTKPTILLINEWTKLLHLGGIQNSTLFDTLDSIFHLNRNWNDSRSDKGGGVNALTGGGDRVCKPPQLTIFAATQPEILIEEVTAELINKGFINRYLILPGPTHTWDMMPSEEEMPIRDSPKLALKGMREKLAPLNGYVWGEGRDWRIPLPPEVREAVKPWGNEKYQEMMGTSNLAANRKKRLHFYFHHIIYLSAWSRKAKEVSMEDVEVAKEVVELSEAFADRLWKYTALPITVLDQSKAQLEEEVVERIEKRPNYYDDERMRQSLRRVWKGLGRGKIREVMQGLIRDRTVYINPDTRCYVIRGPEHSTTARAKRLQKME